MIDPDHLERVRVVARPKDESQVITNWSYAREALVPVWGSLLTYYAARTWLIVEGHNDKRAYVRVSKACAARGLASLPDDLPIVPAGGDQADYLVSELTSRGMSVVVLLDGDAAGRKMRQKIAKIPGVKQNAVIGLDEVDLGINDPEEQKLFISSDERARAFSRNPHDDEDHGFFDTVTLERFAKVFSRLNDALKAAG